MTFSTRLAAVAALCTLPAGAALAQTQEGGMQQDAMGERSADQVTCADIVTMDSQLIPGVLYFVSGYQQAGMSGAAGMSGSGMPEGASGSTDAGGAATSGADASDAGQPADAAQTADANQSADADQMAEGESSMKPQGQGQETGTSAPADSPAAGSDDAMQGDQPAVVRVTGLFEIPIAEVVTLCGESPEMSVSDAVEQQRTGSSGSSSN